MKMYAFHLMEQLFQNKMAAFTIKIYISYSLNSLINTEIKYMIGITTHLFKNFFISKLDVFFILNTSKLSYIGH